MTVKEYIEKDLPFYHVTGLQNLKNILKEGLLSDKAKHKDGIYVIRGVTKDDLLPNNITQNENIEEKNKKLFHIIAREKLSTQDHNTDGTQKYYVFKLLPQKHHIKYEDVAQDLIDEKIAPLHNIVRKQIIKVEEGDICEPCFTPKNIDFTEIEKDISLNKLEDYYNSGKTRRKEIEDLLKQFE